MGRVFTWVLVIVLALVGGSVASNLAPIRELYDSLFNRQTTVATGDVVLKRLQEQKTLVAATGTFEVPVVVCNGSPESYDLQGQSDGQGRTPAQQLLEACSGVLDEKATVLASAEVDAVLDLSKLTANDITISGSSVSVVLPELELSEPRIDAEGGIAVIGKKGSLPIVGGDLPDDYQARAAGAAKSAVSTVAETSGLPQMGSRSAQSLFTSLLSALGFTKVDVSVPDAVGE